MPRGAPDYSNVRAFGPSHRLDDMAELAARLGSPVLHSRSGRVIYIETFEYGVEMWHGVDYGTDGDVHCSTQRTRTGAYSCKLVADTNGSYCAKIFRSFPMPEKGRYGFEFSCLLKGDVETLDWALTYHDGVYAHQYRARYRQSENDIQIKLGEDDWVTVVSDIELAYLYADFQVVKIIVDLENDVWIGLILNDVAYNFSTHDAYIFEEDGGPDVVSTVQIWGTSARNAVAFVDDIIITQNEP